MFLILLWLTQSLTQKVLSSPPTSSGQYYGYWHSTCCYLLVVRHFKIKRSCLIVNNNYCDNLYQYSTLYSRRVSQPLDFAGPLLGQMWLIVVDACSKWPEVTPMSTTTAKHTIQELRLIFARFGLLENIVIDNGPQFVSKEFNDFTSQNGIRHSKIEWISRNICADIQNGDEEDVNRRR